MYTYKEPRKNESPDNKSNDPEHINHALEQSEKDIAGDADLSIHSPNDDLDEGETARLGEDKTDLV
ncbi:MAG: hypothetical protein JWN76_1013 [Chitinophagaceae bacterium]|nr:hypothetical protein [Chitinophagaceae bacterium]